MRFGQYNVSYTGLAEHFAAAQLSPQDRNRWDAVFDYSPADPPNFGLLHDTPPVQLDGSLSATPAHCDRPVAPGGDVLPASAESAELDGAAPSGPTEVWHEGSTAAKPRGKAAAGLEGTAAEGGGPLGLVAAAPGDGPRAAAEAPIEDLVEEEVEEMSIGERTDSHGAASPNIVTPPAAAGAVVAGLGGTGLQGGAANRRARPASAKGKTLSEKVLREITTPDMINDGTRSLGAPPPARAAHHPDACTPTTGLNPPHGGHLLPATLDQLHTLLLGSPTAEWSPAWRYQAIEFSREPATPYGLLQHHGGCCGVLAAVQAFLVRRLLSPSGGGSGADLSTLPAGPLVRDQTPSEVQARVAEARGAALLDALCDILLLAVADGGGAEPVANGADGHGTVHIAICSKDSLPSRRGVLSALACHSLPASRQAVRAFLEARAPAFCKPGGSGVVLFVYSLLLTRGLDATRLQMDSPTAPLIDRRGYCTQELVNSLCVGRAVSNVFDGSRTLHATGGGGDAITMHGLESRAPVGLLCLAESLGHCQVGEWYKQPQWPVWLCCMESHYSVLFSPSGVPPPGEHKQGSAPFQLVYYDQLGHMDEHILLTIHPAEHPGAGGPQALVPPLDETLRTRWPAARVDWGHTDPLL